MKANLNFYHYCYLCCLQKGFAMGNVFIFTFTIKMLYKCDNSKQTICKIKIQETKWLEWDKKYMKTTFMPMSHNTKVPRSSVIKPECVIMQAVIQRCSLKQVFLKSRKILEKYPGRYLILKLQIVTCNLKLNFSIGILPGFC